MLRLARTASSSPRCFASALAAALVAGGALVFFPSCTIFATRPVQEMSNTAAAMRAAKEVQADTLAPELFRQASEWFFKAKKEYKFKNFKLAREYGEKARRFAEEAEFEALRNGGNRTDVPPDPYGPEGTPPPPAESPLPKYDYPTPTGTPVDAYEQRKAEEEAKKTPPTPTPVPGAAGNGAGAPPVQPPPTAPVPNPT